MASASFSDFLAKQEAAKADAAAANSGVPVATRAPRRRSSVSSTVSSRSSTPAVAATSQPDAATKAELDERATRLSLYLQNFESELANCPGGVPNPANWTTVAEADTALAKVEAHLNGEMLPEQAHEIVMIAADTVEKIAVAAGDKLSIGYAAAIDRLAHPEIQKTPEAVRASKRFRKVEIMCAIKHHKMMAWADNPDLQLAYILGRSFIDYREAVRASSAGNDQSGADIPAGLAK